MTYFRTVYTIEVLSDMPLDAYELDAIVYECTNGGFSGDILETTQEVLTASEMAKALIAQGSDPEFLVNEEDMLLITEGVEE